MEKMMSIFLALLCTFSMLFCSTLSTFAYEKEIGVNDSHEGNSSEIVPYYEIAHTFTENSLGGTAASYTQQMSSSTYNISMVGKVINNINVASEFCSKFAPLTDFASLSLDLFVYAATNCITAQAFNDADPNAASMRITKYKNPTLSIAGNEYYRYVVDYYKQANCVGYICTEDYFETYTYN